MTDGTPLRKFGYYRVRQLKRRTPFFALVDERDGTDIVMSYCKGAVEYVGGRLGAGRMVVTPQEYESWMLATFASSFPTRFWFANEAWLLGQLGERWMFGGPVPRTNVEAFSVAGRARQREKELRDRANLRADLGEESWAVVAHVYDENDAESDRVRALYAAGTWPDVDVVSDDPTQRRWRLRGHRKLYDVYRERCPILALLTTDAAPEWVDAGRDAMRLLLRYGEDGVTPMRATLREWATQLAAKHGGEWIGT